MNISRTLSSLISPYSNVGNTAPTQQMSTISLSTSATSGSSSSTGSSTSTGDTFRSDFASMLAAVQAGDMSTAQTALTSLQGDVQSAGYSPSSSTSAAMTAADPSASSPQSDLDALIQAVKSGDTTSAQAALTQLQTDGQNAMQQSSGSSSGSQATQGHRHHHHHGGGGGGVEAAVAQAFDTTSSSSSSSSTSTSSDSSNTQDTGIETALA